MFAKIALLSLSLLAGASIGVAVDGQCADGCKVLFFPAIWGGPGANITFTLPPLPGHGICTCLFTTCATERDCAETISVTFTPAPGTQLCDINGVGNRLPVTRTFSVSQCGKADGENFDVCPGGIGCAQCNTNLFLSFYMGCTDCDGTCQF